MLCILAPRTDWHRIVTKKFMHQILLLSVRHLSILYTFGRESRKIVPICEEYFPRKQDHHQPIALDIKFQALQNVSASVCSQLQGILALKDIYSPIAQHVSINRR